MNWGKCAGFVSLCAILATSGATAGNSENDGKAVAIALPVVAGGLALWKDDWQGVAQLVVSTGLTVGTAYGIKQLVREERPDHSDFKSFPSDTSALAFAPAQFLWQRYGWEYGLPAYAAAAYVGYARVNSKQHHWWDVAASAAISLGYNELITSRYHQKNFYTAFNAGPSGVYGSLHYRW